MEQSLVFLFYYNPMWVIIIRTATDLMCKSIFRNYEALEFLVKQNSPLSRVFHRLIIKLRRIQSSSLIELNDMLDPIDTVPMSKQNLFFALTKLTYISFESPLFRINSSTRYALPNSLSNFSTSIRHSLFQKQITATFETPRTTILYEIIAINCSSTVGTFTQKAFRVDSSV